MTRPAGLRWLVPLAALAALAGCGPVHKPKPVLYRVQGRVLDAETKQGVAYVRLLLRAAVQTTLGPKVLSAYGISGADGGFTVELSEGFDVVRYATKIQLDAAKRGYRLASLDVPPPARKLDAYRLPDLLIAPVPGSVPPEAPPGAGLIPWKE